MVKKASGWSEWAGLHRAQALRVHVPNNGVLGIWGIVTSIGFGQVYDYWVLGPLGL